MYLQEIFRLKAGLEYPHLENKMQRLRVAIANSNGMLEEARASVQILSDDKASLERVLSCKSAMLQTVQHEKRRRDVTHQLRTQAMQGHAVRMLNRGRMRAHRRDRVRADEEEDEEVQEEEPPHMRAHRGCATTAPYEPAGNRDTKRRFWQAIGSQLRLQQNCGVGLVLKARHVSVVPSPPYNESLYMEPMGA